MFKTGISGLSGAVIDVTTMVVLVELLAMPAGIAAFLGAAAGAGCSFTIAKFWAFGDRTPVDPRQVGAYGLVSLGTALIVALSVHTLVELAGVQYLVAKVASSIGSFLFWSYPLQSRVVFARVSRDPAVSIH